MFTRVSDRIKCLALAIAFLAGSAAMAQASTIVFTSDGSWLAKNAAPGAGWNTSAGFNTAADGGWQSATVSIPDCSGSMDCIWYDGINSLNTEAYLRQTFVLDGPAVSGSLTGGANDDSQIWINGFLVWNDTNGVSTGFGPLDITPYLVAGNNLIAVHASDNYLVFGYEHAFAAQVTAETASTVPTAVPEPASLLLFGSGITLIARRFHRRSS